MNEQCTLYEELVAVGIGGGITRAGDGWRWCAYRGAERREGWERDRTDADNARHAHEMAMAGAPGWAERAAQRNGVPS